MARPPSLDELQRSFSRLMRAPAGVAAVLPEASPAERDLCYEWTRSTPSLDSVSRLEIYANMYFYRLHDALADDFPTVRAVMGREHFHNLVTDYLLAHPSHHFSLRYAGNRLAAFLRTHPARQRWPFLPDLARLEWLVLEAFDAADAGSARADTLLAIPPERWGAITLDWIPALYCFAAAWPVHELWQSGQEDGPLPSLAARPCSLRVWRREERVFVAEIPAWEARLLGRSEPFAVLCAELAEESGEQEAAERLADWLARCVAQGLVRAVREAKCE